MEKSLNRFSSSQNNLTAFCLIAIGTITGCSDSNVRDDMVKIKGVVLVDHEPAEGVVLHLHPKSGSAAISSGITDADGAFQISTYSLGDGAPVGDYAITMVWSKFDVMTRTQVGDHLQGKYASQDKTKIEWTIPATDVFDAGTIELKRK